jgi:hypothetical protein
LESLLIWHSEIILALLNRVEYLFGVLDPACHFGVFGLEGFGEGFIGLSAFLTGKQHSFFISIEQDLAVIKEVDLEDFIAESEHDGMFCFEPLLYVDELVVFLVGGFRGSDFGDFVIEVDDEFLEKHELFLEVFVVGQGVVLFPHVRVNLNVFVLARRVLNIGDSPKLLYTRYFLSPSIDISDESLK